jgi:hypothetical protein
LIYVVCPKRFLGHCRVIPIEDQWRKAVVTAIDKEYYQKRALQEREREKNAPDRAAAQVHAEMAEEYERMLRNLEDDIAA